MFRSSSEGSPDIFVNYRICQWPSAWAQLGERNLEFGFEFRRNTWFNGMRSSDASWAARMTPAGVWPAQKTLEIVRGAATPLTISKQFKKQFNKQFKSIYIRKSHAITKHGLEIEANLNWTWKNNLNEIGNNLNWIWTQFNPIDFHRTPHPLGE